MAKWPNHFISGKQFQKRPNSTYLAFLKAKWQPWSPHNYKRTLPLFFEAKKPLDYLVCHFRYGECDELCYCPLSSLNESQPTDWQILLNSKKNWKLKE